MGKQLTNANVHVHFIDEALTHDVHLDHHAYCAHMSLY